jgi:hypothetical protein
MKRTIGAAEGILKTAAREQHDGVHLAQTKTKQYRVKNRNTPRRSPICKAFLSLSAAVRFYQRT